MAMSEYFESSLHSPQAFKTVLYGGLGGIFLFSAFRYRASIRRRLRQVQEESLMFGGLRMARETRSNAVDKTRSLGRTMVLELNPSFCKLQEKEWRLTSLGDYMSTLRPGVIPGNVKTKDIPDWIQSEVEAGLATSLIKILGPTAGRALLPTIGMGPVPSVLDALTSRFVARYLSRQSQAKDGDEDRGFLSLTLYSLLAASDINATRVSNQKKRHPENVTHDLTAIEKMKRGEFGPTPSFDSTFTTQDASTTEKKLLIPNPFIVSEHWDSAIRRMEELVSNSTAQGEVTQMEADARSELQNPTETQEAIKAPSQVYDPHGREMADPIPINEKLFPDLHMGWGDAKCTHTHREIVRNRLVAVLLNRLAANYHGSFTGATTESPFQIQFDSSGAPISRPHEFLSALVKTGHELTMHVTTQPTTFGVAMCVKEGDGGWTNVPLSFFFGSGYEDAKGRPAPAMLPHGGVNLEIRGPLVGSSSKCSLQHYMAIQGMCGWHSNHNASVPWITEMQCGPSVKGNAAVRASRVIALHGVLLNVVGTEMDLPFGGYGLTAVCNDTAAVLECSLHGSTHIYPLTSVGRFSMHVIRYAGRVQGVLAKDESMASEAKDMDTLIQSIRKIPSDLHASPQNAPDSLRRMLHCLPRDLPLQLMVQTKEVTESILNEYKNFDR